MDSPYVSIFKFSCSASSSVKNRSKLWTWSSGSRKDISEPISPSSTEPEMYCLVSWQVATAVNSSPNLETEQSNQEPTDTSKPPIRTRHLGHVTGYQPFKDQYFLILLVPVANLPVP
eukprot:sb/3476572/